MMKRMCCLVAVLALTGSASAVNIVWNRGAETSKSLTMPSGNFSAALLLTTTARTGGGADTKIVSFDNFYQTEILRFKNAEGIGAHHFTWWSEPNTATNTGQHSVVLNFTKQANGSYKIGVFVDGVRDIRTENYNDGTRTPISDTLSLTFVENSTLWTYEGFAIYDDVLTTDEMNTLQTTRDVESIVPEPSFLALLALGAGALALRRKAKCA